MTHPEGDMLEPILLVEDDPRDLELTLLALGKCHLANEVVTARDGAEALDYLHFITSVEGNQIFTDVSTWLPAIRGVKASAYSRQFLPFYDGYSWGGFMNLSGVDATTFIRNRYYRLWGPTGGAKAYADELDGNLRPRVLTDLTREVSTQLQNLTREDSAATARCVLEPAPGSALSLLPARLEGRTLQLIDALRDATAGKNSPQPK